MAIIQKVSFFDFERAFINAGRGNQFTCEGLRSLFDYLDVLSFDLGEHIELDVIELCCDYVELTLEEVVDELDLSDFYYKAKSDGLSDDEVIDDVIEQLSEVTSVVDYNFDEKENQYYILFKAY